jgi:uncharacterized protein YhbP (UPF0306 family)
MNDRSTIDRVLAANLYLVLGTADEDGQPWVSPVFFAQLGPNRLCWVSSPDARHSRNISHRNTIAITVFDSTFAVGRAEAAYFDAHAAPASPDEADAALQSLNARLPSDKALNPEDLQPHGPLVVYRADLKHSYILVRGGDPEHGNAVDTTVEV